MQTPEEQTMRRSTRRALSEIPTHLGMLSVADLESTNFNHCITFKYFFKKLILIIH